METIRIDKKEYERYERLREQQRRASKKYYENRGQITFSFPRPDKERLDEMARRLGYSGYAALAKAEAAERLGIKKE